MVWCQEVSPRPPYSCGPGYGTPATFVEGVLPLAAAAYVVGMRGVPGPVSQTRSDLCMLLEPRRHLAPERGVLLGVVKIHRCLQTLGLGSRGDIAAAGQSASMEVDRERELTAQMAMLLGLAESASMPRRIASRWHGSARCILSYTIFEIRCRILACFALVRDWAGMPWHGDRREFSPQEGRHIASTLDCGHPVHPSVGTETRPRHA